MKHTRIFITVIALMASSALMGQGGKGNKRVATLVRSVYFETASFQLDSAANATIAPMIDSLKLYSKYQIFIKGNTDNVGDSLYNLKLANDRAEAVKNVFTGAGVATNFITTNSLGENQPLASNETDQGKQMNRRVDIMVNYTRRVDTFYDFWSKCAGLFPTKSTNYCIEPNRDTVIVGPKGTIIIIPANSFQGISKKYNGCINISLQEYYDKPSMLAAHLSTVNGSNALQSSGMIYIEATASGQKLDLKSRKKIIVNIPRQDELPAGTKMFEGDWQTLRDHQWMNWNATSKTIIQQYDADAYEPFCGIEGLADKRCRLFFCKILKAIGLKKDKVDLLKDGCASNDTACQRMQKELLNGMGFNPDKVKDKDKRAVLLQSVAWRMQMYQGINESSTAKAATTYAVSYVGKLGWTNWDAFCPEKNKTVITFSKPIPDHVDMNIVFKDRNTILPRFAEGKDFTTNAIVPAGIPVSLVALKWEKGKMYMQVLDFTTGETVPELDLQETTADQILQTFQNFK